MGFVIGFAIVAAVVLMGGGNTLKGLGSDLQTTGSVLQSKVNGRMPSRSEAARPTETVPQLPSRTAEPYATDSTQHTIPAVKEETVQ